MKMIYNMEVNLDSSDWTTRFSEQKEIIPEVVGRVNTNPVLSPDRKKLYLSH